MTKRILSQKTLKELIHYDPGTGIFTWKERGRKWFKSPNSCKSWNTRFSGNTAGYCEISGYIEIRMLGGRYRAHRLVFLYMAGDFPTNDTDHINGVRSDSRWMNLRSVTRKENMKNMATPKSNTSGRMGVSRNKRDRKWVANIQVNGKQVYLGGFKEFEDAAACRGAAEVKYGYHSNHSRAANGEDIHM